MITPPSSQRFYCFISLKTKFVFSDFKKAVILTEPSPCVPLETQRGVIEECGLWGPRPRLHLGSAAYLCFRASLLVVLCLSFYGYKTRGRASMPRACHGNERKVLGKQPTEGGEPGPRTRASEFEF